MLVCRWETGKLGLTHFQEFRRRRLAVYEEGETGTHKAAEAPCSTAQMRTRPLLSMVMSVAKASAWRRLATPFIGGFQMTAQNAGGPGSTRPAKNCSRDALLSSPPAAPR
jgi:hypothetical protein